MLSRLCACDFKFFKTRGTNKHAFPAAPSNALLGIKLELASVLDTASESVLLQRPRLWHLSTLLLAAVVASDVLLCICIIADRGLLPPGCSFCDLSNFLSLPRGVLLVRSTSISELLSRRFSW
jgi:hypothetical protein